LKSSGIALHYLVLSSPPWPPSVHRFLLRLFQLQLQMPALHWSIHLPLLSTDSLFQVIDEHYTPAAVDQWFVP
jgi:hypothetical protein